MKKLIALMLALVLSVAAFGCNNAPADDEKAVKATARRSTTL